MYFCHSKEWRFLDVVNINIRGGCGGDGCMAMVFMYQTYIKQQAVKFMYYYLHIKRREFKTPWGGPAGGNGGHGGSVYIRCDESLSGLDSLRRKVHIRASDGQNGQGKGVFNFVT